MGEWAGFRPLSHRVLRTLLLGMVLVTLSGWLVIEGASGASVTEQILQRLGTSVEARILTLSSNDLPTTAVASSMMV